MTKKNNYDFSIPNRQSLVAILLVVFKTARVVFRQLAFPLIVVLFIGKKSDSFAMYIIIMVIVFSLFSMVYSIINYFKTYFYIKGTDLVIHSGFISKKHLTIPFERIQTINFEQTILHRIFDVKKVKIDTAGSGDQELELAALESEKADALRDLLISGKSRMPKIEIQSVQHNTVEKREEEIFHLNFIDLIKAGLFENHLRSIGLIVAAAWYIYTNAQEVGINAEDYIDRLPPVIYGIYIAASAAIFLLIVSVLISLIRTVLKYFNLKFSRINKGFKINQGLFNTVTISALDQKIQTVGWSDNVLKKLIGIFDLQLKQAKGKSSKEEKQNITIPGTNKQIIDQVVNYLFPNENIAAIEMKKIHISFRNRQQVFAAIIPLIIILVAIFNSEWMIMAAAIIALILLEIMVVLKFRKIAYGYNDEIIKLNGGIFGDKNTLSYIHKIQEVKQNQSPFQRKRGLVSLVLKNAGGIETIPYIAESEASHIMNLFLKKVEIDKRNAL